MPKTLTQADFADGGQPVNDTPPKDTVVDGGPDKGGIGDDKAVVEPVKDGKPAPKKKDEAPPKLKYADHQTAEAAAREAEKRMHKATEEAAMLRKLLLERNAEPEKGKGPSEEEKLGEKAILEIRKLDREDPDYDIKCGQIWAKYNRQIAKLEAENTANMRDREDAKNKSLETKIDDSLAEAGYKSEWDKKAFFVLSNYVPADITDQDEQIEWVIGQIADYRKAVLKDFSDKEVEETENRNNLKVLGKGSVSKPRVSTEDEEYKPKTLGEQVKELRAGRKLK